MGRISWLRRICQSMDPLRFECQSMRFIHGDGCGTALSLRQSTTGKEWTEGMMV